MPLAAPEGVMTRPSSATNAGIASSSGLPPGSSSKSATATCTPPRLPTRCRAKRLPVRLVA